MRHPTRHITALLIILLFTGVPTFAGPVVITEVVQTLNQRQASVDLSVRNVSQEPGSSNSKNGKSSKGTNGFDGATLPDSLLSGVNISSDPPNIGAEIIADGEVEGTVCDCGEILVPGGAFPKWPFLFLAAIPIFFINDCDECDDVTPTPTPLSAPTPPDTPKTVPEPASLLLLGTGMLAFGAGMRRRYLAVKFNNQIQPKGEE